MSLIEDYLNKRAAAVAAEKAMSDIVNKLHMAAQNFGDGYDRSGSLMWKRILIPGIPPQSVNRQFGTSSFPHIPAEADVMKVAMAYWTAIAIADQAYAALPKEQQEGLYPPPK